MSDKCACGRPLHYTDPAIEETMRSLVADLGETVTITTPDGKWRVPRHYIALHGIKAEELPALAEKYGFKRSS